MSLYSRLWNVALQCCRQKLSKEYWRVMLLWDTDTTSVKIRCDIKPTCPDITVLEAQAYQNTHDSCLTQLPLNKKILSLKRANSTVNKLFFHSFLFPLVNVYISKSCYYAAPQNAELDRLMGNGDQCRLMGINNLPHQSALIPTLKINSWNLLFIDWHWSSLGIGCKMCENLI